MATQEATTTRERLLEAAGEVFAEAGFRGATVRAICKRADANVAAINYHFGDKEALYRETLDYAFSQMHRQHPSPTAWPAGTPVIDRLREFVSAFLSRLLAVQETWHGRLMARELAQPTGAIGLIAERHVRPKLEVLDGVIAVACPELDADQRHLHVLGLIGQCVFFRHARPVLDALYGPECFQRDRIPAITEHIVTVFLRGLSLDPHEASA